jgi:hypothetical protein
MERERRLKPSLGKSKQRATGIGRRAACTRWLSCGRPGHGVGHEVGDISRADDFTPILVEAGDAAKHGIARPGSC